MKNLILMSMLFLASTLSATEHAQQECVVQKIEPVVLEYTITKMDTMSIIYSVEAPEVLALPVVTEVANTIEIAASTVLIDFSYVYFRPVLYEKNNSSRIIRLNNINKNSAPILTLLPDNLF